MNNKDSVSTSRQWSIESGLTQAIRPVLVCTPDESIPSAKQQGSEQLLCVPQTAESKMAKMKKKIQSPLARRKGSGGGTVSSSKTFGVSLEEVCKRPESFPIPWVVVKIVDYLSIHGLKHEGIFRVSGNHKVVETMKTALDRDGDTDLEELGDIMAVAGLLKLYLRELPEPPVPQSLTADFIRVHEVYGDDNLDCLDELRALLDKLPYLNYHLIKFICRFLVEVSTNEGNNKMSTMALAIVFGPNIFRCQDGLEGLREQGHTNAIVCKFLKEYDNLFKDEEEEISPYATTTLFVQDTREPESNPVLPADDKSEDKVTHDSSTSDEESPRGTKTKAHEATHLEEPIYASVKKPKKPKKHLHPPTSVSSSSEELDMYVRSVSPSPSWNNNGNGHGTSHTTVHSQRHGSAGRDVVQMAIKDSIKEHLFGPDGVSTDECSDLSRVHSTESLDEDVAPPLPVRQYGVDEEVNKQRRKRRKNLRIAKGQQEENIKMESVEPMMLQQSTETQCSHGEAVEESGSRPLRSNKKRPKPKPLETFDRKDIIISLDKNSNTIIKTLPTEIGKPCGGSPEEVIQNDLEDAVIPTEGTEYQKHEEYDSDEELSLVKRDSEILSTLTLNRAPPPKNRRPPSVKKDSQDNEPGNVTKPASDEDNVDGAEGIIIPKKFVHPLVEEAKSRDVVATPPPRSPRSPKVPKSPPSPLSPNKHTTVDELDSGYNPVKELTKQYKKRHRSTPVVPPLELYKLQQGDIDDHVQRSPRERYDGLSSEEALLSPRSRPLMIDTKSYPTECPPSPPHEQVEHFWYERRLDTSPKGEVTVKQLSKNIHQLKKKIREFEDSFEAENGYKPSHSDKAPVKKHIAELTRCRKQLRELKEKAKEESERLNETAPPLGQLPEPVEPLLTTTPASVQQSLNNILRKLQDKRKAAGRSDDLKSLTLEELQDEKLTVQKALLQHESIFGRPTTKKDKDIMRPLYDRYRMIKRKLVGSKTDASEGEQNVRPDKDSRPELDPIHEREEHSSEEQLFSPSLLKKSDSSVTLESNQSRKRRDCPSDPTSSAVNVDEDGEELVDTLTLVREHDTRLHRMSQEELETQVESAKREKKRLRKKLKKFEDDFFDKTGRRIQRDDRGDMEKDYHDYKQVKARLRLLDALLSKRQASQTI